MHKNYSPKEHNIIGMIIKLLPYVNFNTNIICENPNESDERLIKPLKQKDILDILNISRPTISSLLKIKILNGTEYAFIKFSNGSFKNVYVINPTFMFKGNNDKSFEKCHSWFKLGL